MAARPVAMASLRSSGHGTTLSLSGHGFCFRACVCVLCRAPRRVLARDRHLCRRSDSAAEGKCKLTRLETDSSRQAPLRISPGALARVWDAQFVHTLATRVLAPRLSCDRSCDA